MYNPYLNKTYTKCLTCLLMVTIIISSIPVMSSDIPLDNDPNINRQTHFLRQIISSDRDKIDPIFALILIENGAYPNIRNDKGETILMRVVRGEVHPNDTSGSGLIKKSIMGLILIIGGLTIYDSRDIIYDQFANLIGDDSASRISSSLEENTNQVVGTVEELAKNGIRNLNDMIEDEEEIPGQIELIEALIESGAQPHLRSPVTGKTSIEIAAENDMPIEVISALSSYPYNQEEEMQNEEIPR